MTVHSALRRFLDVLVKSVCRQSDYRDRLRIGTVKASYLPRRFKSVHNRHTNVHKYRIVVIFRRIGKFPDSILTVFRGFNDKSLVFKQLYSYHSVDLIIFRKKKPASLYGNIFIFRSFTLNL